jgi:spermidine/putrescine transport system substrate-binding protein
VNPLDRRRFLRNALLGAGALAVGPRVLSACGGDDGDAATTTTAAGSTTTAGGGGGAGKLSVSNWQLYMDPALLEAFSAQTGITVDYQEDYNDNEEYFAKVQPDLSYGRGIGRDIVIPTSWMAGRWNTLGFTQPLPLDKVPNAKNLIPRLQKPSWDPEGNLTLPWQTGIGGVAYNAKAAGREFTSVADFFDPAYKGQVTMLTEMRDSLGLVLLDEGIDISKVTFDQAQGAFDRIEAAKNDGHIRAFTGNEYTQDLSNGNLVAAIAWSGDVFQIARDNPDIKFLVPEAGATYWADVMVVPVGAENIDAAAAWMDFFYDPENAATLAEFVQYISPVAGVQEIMKSRGGEAAALAESSLLFPTESDFERLRFFANLSEEEDAKFAERWASIIVG